jgi:signal transduction histidine kinase
MAVKLSTRQNPLTEDRYDQIAEQLNSDSVIQKYVQNDVRGTQLSDSLNNYLKRTYFQGYWRRYSIQITNCQPRRELLVQPQGYYIDCRKYFQDLITNYGHSATNSNLYYLDYGFGREYYLAVLTFPATNGSEADQVKIYIEFILNSSVTDPGYPGLLMDQDHNKIPDLDDYSYAIYQHNRLAYSVGPVTYPIEMLRRTDSLAPQPVYLENDIWHYHFNISKGSDLLISKTKNGLLSLITPFSYLFILFAITAIFVAGTNLLRHGIRFSAVDLRTKLQLSSSGILILTMLIIGIVQVFYIININGRKNRDYLREKSYSVLTEVQHKFGRAGTVAELNAMEPENFLIKLSNVFFTDINLYDSNGTMISSSRREIFQKNLVAERMDPLAFRKMAVEQNSLFIHDEEIGTMRFGSAYIPMYNEQGKILVYLNLPYFARQDELKKEISSLLVTFGNIYILLILFGSLITFIISNYITSPLSLLSGKMGHLKLGRTNEKIVWKTDDEIGKLVAGYNRMVDDLEKSAAQLALTEREGAWREMARQVAHEIKNPLTPMKLSAQYLQKSWNDHAPDMDQRITRFTQTLVNQIDTLAEIASGFSDFAKMPAPQPELIDLVEVVKTVLTWYPDSTGISYVLETAMVHAEIWADRSQLIRVVSNLINNAVQAIGIKPGGLVTVRIVESQQQIILEISDNGTGIKPERASKIFQPDFTTKTGGMGLGLSIVKAIIVEMKGEISFTSEVDSGTTFIIKLPSNGQSTHEKKT